jgi:hypothetical protein
MCQLLQQGYKLIDCFPLSTVTLSITESTEQEAENASLTKCGKEKEIAGEPSKLRRARTCAPAGQN